MVLDNVFGVNLPALVTHDIAMNHRKSTAAEGRMGGALWQEYDNLYWDTRMDVDAGGMA